jgi:peptide/nickel transport system substrate-binding protein
LPRKNLLGRHASLEKERRFGRGEVDDGEYDKFKRGLCMISVLFSTAIAANLRYAEDQAPAIVNPLFGTTMSEARVSELLFGSLYGDNEELAVVPRLASTAELSADRTEMIITLRADLKWTDGTAFTAKDVVFTIKAMKDPGTASTEAGRVAFIKEALVMDDSHVKLIFVRPEATPEARLLFKILPASRFTSTAIKRTDPFRTAPIGTGPYTLLRYNDDNSISFSANPYYDPVPGISQVTLKEVSDKNYQAKLLLYESLEALVRVLPRDLPVLENNKKVELYPYQTNSWWYLGFNLSRFPDVRVRQAISSLMDISRLLAPIGTGDLLTGPFVKSSPYYNHEIPAPKKDTTAAETLLTEAGYTKVNGAWSQGGRPLSLKITANQSLESAQEVVINMQSQLQSQGLAVSVEFLDEAAWKSRIWSARDFELILSQWSFDRNEDVREQFYTRGTRNFTGYSNPAVDVLLDTARDAVDPAVRKSTLRQVHAQIHNDYPMIFLWTLDNYAAISTRVKNVLVHPFYFFTWLPSWQLK